MKYKRDNVFRAKIGSVARSKFTLREMKRYCKSLPTATASSPIPSKSQLLLCVLNDEEREDKQAEVDLQVYDLTSSLLYPASRPTATLKLAASELGGEDGALAEKRARQSQKANACVLFPSARKNEKKILISCRLTGVLNARLLCRSRPSPIIFPSASERNAHTHRPPPQLCGDE